MEPRKKTWRDSARINMFLSAVSVLVVVQLSSEVPKKIMNIPVYILIFFLPKSILEEQTSYEIC
jgi:hypothetical protein